MPGLLDFANTDDGMQGLGLLAAAAPSMAPMNLAGRLAQAAKGYQGMKEDMLKQQEAAQIFQIKNIALQQQQQQFAMQQPIMQALSGKMMQRLQPQVAQVESQPSAMPYGGAPRDMLSGDPVQRSQPQAPQQPMQSQSGGTMLPNVPDEVAMWALGSGGMGAIPKLLEEYNKPTDFQKTIVGAGVDPNSAQGRKMMLDNIAKANHLAPTRLGEGAYATADGKVVGLPSAAQPGFINEAQPDGTWTTKEIGGGLAAVTGSGVAKARGPATMDPQKIYNPEKKQFEYQTRASVADAANGKNAPPGNLKERDMRNFANVARIPEERPTPQMLAEVNAQLSKPGLNAMQRQIFTAERDRLSAGLQGPQQPQQPQQPATAPSGAFAAEPSLGATANADKANAVSAQSMKDSYDKVRAAAAAAPAARDAIAEMKQLAAKKVPFVQSGLIGGVTAAVSTDAAKYEKLRANLTAQLASTFGTNDSDKGRDLAGQMVPDYTKPVSAQHFGLDSLDRQLQTQQLKNQVLSPYVQKSDSVKYTELESKFDQAIAPSLIPKLMPILSMPKSASRGMLLKNLMQDPAMNKALNFAADNGLLK